MSITPISISVRSQRAAIKNIELLTLEQVKQLVLANGICPITLRPLCKENPKAPLKPQNRHVILHRNAGFNQTMVFGPKNLQFPEQVVEVDSLSRGVSNKEQDKWRAEWNELWPQLFPSQSRAVQLGTLSKLLAEADCCSHDHLLPKEFFKDPLWGWQKRAVPKLAISRNYDGKKGSQAVMIAARAHQGPVSALKGLSLHLFRTFQKGHYQSGMDLASRIATIERPASRVDSPTFMVVPWTKDSNNITGQRNALASCIAELKAQLPHLWNKQQMGHIPAKLRQYHTLLADVLESIIGK